jgi:CO/xanthine dehydrogenase Mo-binding subunit
MEEPVLEGVPLPKPAAGILREILKVAGVAGANVTSAYRTPAEQARVMYENCVSKGGDYNHALYCASGDHVVDVFEANHDQPRDTVIQLMTEKILEIGPSNVSMHMSDTHYTFDVAPSSIPADRHAAFVAAALRNKAVSKLLQPPKDPAFHLEIPKDRAEQIS